ncbi:hypothetical protein [Spiroplasma diminutum]|nr:hypothetical protein [Spiroplasma diminutum]
MKRSIHTKICFKCKNKIEDGDVYKHFEEQDIFSNKVLFYAHNKCLK